MMSPEALSDLLALYEGARAVRASSYGSHPWKIQAADGSLLEGWREPSSDLPGYSVRCYRLKRDAEAGRLAFIEKILTKS
jgi:hypothetical protein